MELGERQMELGQLMRYAHINPFNDRVNWNEYSISDLRSAWELYHEQTVSKYVHKKQIPPKQIAYDSAHLELTKRHVVNLRRYSVYYDGHFTRHPIDDKTNKIWIAIENVQHNDLNLNLDLCIDLIWANCQNQPALPDFQKTDLGEFLDICMYFGLEAMLNKMDYYCLTLGLTYLPEYFAVMYRKFTPNFPRLKSLLHEFAMRFTVSTTYPFSAYFPKLEGQPPVVCGRRLAERVYSNIFILSGLVRSFIQSPKFRLIQPLPICPACELQVNDTDIPACTTRCCSQLIHRACRDKVRFCSAKEYCEICNHAVSSLILLRNMTRTDLLNDRKMRHWYRCRFHYNCNIYLRPNWHCIFHRSAADLKALSKAPFAKFISLIEPLYEQEYITENIIREHYILTRNENT